MIRTNHKNGQMRLFVNSQPTPQGFAEQRRTPYRIDQFSAHNHVRLTDARLQACGWVSLAGERPDLSRSLRPIRVCVVYYLVSSALRSAQKRTCGSSQSSASTLSDPPASLASSAFCPCFEQFSPTFNHRAPEPNSFRKHVTQGNTFNQSSITLHPLVSNRES